jgi:protein Mpv17
MHTATSLHQRLPLTRSEQSRPFSFSSRHHQSPYHGDDDDHTNWASKDKPKRLWIFRAWDAYTHSLQKYPLKTKCFVAGLIFFTSDSVIQYLTSGTTTTNTDNDTVSFVWDAWRATSGAIFGMIATSYIHYWWNFLEVACERIMPSGRSKLIHTAVKVLLDQSISAPFYVFLYYTVTNFLRNLADEQQHLSVNEAWTNSIAKATSMWWSTMLRHWKLWPLVHCFNFYFAPIQHRVLVQNLVLVGWSGCEFPFSSIPALFSSTGILDECCSFAILLTCICPLSLPPPIPRSVASQ